MRRLALLLLAVVASMPVIDATVAHAAQPAPAPPAATAAARGLVLAGMRIAGAGERCHGSYELVASGRCTHGPDPAPAGVDVRVRRETATAAGTPAPSGTAQAGATLPCYGDGTSGNRVQAIYAHAADVQDRYSQVVGSIRQWAADTDAVFNNSAAETGGIRHIQFVTDSSCSLSVADVQLSATGDDNFSNTIQELSSLGYKASNRKYLVWMDANVYCGIAQVYGDDKATQDNASNGNPQVSGEVARVDNSCWGAPGQSVEAHELMHTLGGVQTSAPHATSFNHCWDASDRMCYADGSGSTMSQVCPTSHENLFDCNHDDYFSTNPPAGSYLSTHWNTANSSFLASTPSTPPSPPNPPSGPATGRLTPLPPARVLDTRNGTGGFSNPVGPDASIDVQVTGVGGVPSSGVSAVVLNVTAVQPTLGSYLTVYPTGGALPLASNLNFIAGQTVPNLVVAKVGSGGKVSIYNKQGSVQVIADVAGWYSDGTSSSLAGLYSALSPARVLDTRNGTGGFSSPVGPGKSIDVQITGVGGVPSSGVSAVVLNVTAVQASLGSYLTVYPTGTTVPLASNLNFSAGETVPNLVVAKVGSGGKVSIYNAQGSVQVVADVAGWYSDGSTPSLTGLYSPLSPARVLDTRNGMGGFSSPVGPGKSIDVPVTGLGGVPSSGVSAVVLNVTATQATQGSYLTAYPTGTSVPLASNLNFGPGQNVPNLVVVKVGAGGKVSIYNAVGATDVIADVAGWYSA